MAPETFRNEHARSQLIQAGICIVGFLLFALVIFFNSAAGRAELVLLLTLFGPLIFLFASIAAFEAYVVVTVDSSGIACTWRYPTTSLRRTFRRADVSFATVVEVPLHVYGEPYFYARVHARDVDDADLEINLAEGPSSDACLEVCMRFNEALYRMRGTAPR